MVSLDNKLQAFFRDIPPMLPPFIRIFNEDQGYMQIYALHKEVNIPDINTKYAMYRNNKFIMCWFVKNMNNLKLVKNTVFEVNPDIDTHKFLFTDILYEISVIDYNHPINQQYTHIHKTLTYIAQKMHADLTLHFDLTITLDIFDSTFDVIINYAQNEVSINTHIIKIKDFNYNTIKDIITNKDEVKNFWFRLQDTCRIKSWCEDECIDDYIEFPYNCKIYYYTYHNSNCWLYQKKHKRLVVTDLKMLMTYLNK